MMIKNIKLKPLLISIAISLAVGGLSALITSGSMDTYKSLATPPLSPPSWIFPVVWTILFILMGISAYLIYDSDSPQKKQALTVYGIQLIINFIWPILFFNMNLYWVSFAWLIILILAVSAMIILFYNIDKLAGYLQIPYLIWLLFAGYLNLAIALMN